MVQRRMPPSRGISADFEGVERRERGFRPIWRKGRRLPIAPSHHQDTMGSTSKTAGIDVWKENNEK